MPERRHYQRFVYPSGLRLLTVPMVTTETVTVLVLVGTGSRYETKDINGISHFLEHMVFKGTEKRPGALDISTELDAIGAEYNAFTGQEYTGYYVKCAAEKLDVALDVISDIFQHSKFDQVEIDKERGAIKEEINMYYDNPARYVGTLYEALMFGDHPLGWDIAGPKENIDRMTRDQFVGYFQTHYVANNTIIAVAGNVETESVKIKVEHYFDSVRQHDRILPLLFTEHQSVPGVKIFNKKTDQTSVNLGFRVPYGRMDPRGAILEVISVILGGGMSSRLFVEVREKRGLAYRIGAGASSFHEAGDFTTSAGLTTSKLEEALSIILGEHRKLIETPVSAKELTKTKDYIKGKFAIGLEPSDAQASYYGEQELLEERILTPEERLAKFDAVTPEQIQQVATELFRTERLNLAIVGPLEESEEKMKKILASW
ncbi:MAG: pitrilysin family protein [Patescibacteria group bacterium]